MGGGRRMPSLSEVWNWVSGLLPDWPVFGFEVSWPVYTASGLFVFFYSLEVCVRSFGGI